MGNVCRLLCTFNPCLNFIYLMIFLFLDVLIYFNVPPVFLKNLQVTADEAKKIAAGFTSADGLYSGIFIGGVK